MDNPLVGKSRLRDFFSGNRKTAIAKSAIAVSYFILKGKNIIRGAIQYAADLFHGKRSDVPVMPELIHGAFVNAVIYQNILGLSLLLQRFP